MLLCFALVVVMRPGAVWSGERADGLDARPFALERIGHIQMPTLDTEGLKREDVERDAQGLAPRYAIPHPVRLTPDDSGTWEIVNNETRIWRLRISSPGAVSINLGFTQYKLPFGAALSIHSTDGDYRIRDFTNADNADHGELWTPPVGGDDILIELTMPTTGLSDYRLELGSINIGYRSFGDIIDPRELVDRSGSCNVDVVCSTGDPWRLQIPAVAVISTGGSLFCTGFMVNNVAGDLTPHFMTAAHCGVTSGNAASLVTFWNFHNSVCRGIPGGSGRGDGSLSQFNTGAVFRASYSPSDFTLVQLNAPPNPAWNISWAGWDRTGANPPRGACIHHPSTNEKRITLYDIDARPDRPTHGSSWGCSPFPGPGDNSHIKAYWSLGVTEPGSSGSPLFDDNKRVIGQLHGGPSACGQTGDNLSDCYGRFSLSWTGGGTSSTRLSNWLDPGGTNPNFVDTISGGGLSVSPGGNVTHIGVVGGPFSNTPTNYTISNQTASPANYEVSILGGGTAPLLLDGGPGPLTGTLNPATNVMVAVTVDAAADSLPAGVYTSTVRFRDTTNNLTFDRIHTLEIGQTNFTTAPANGLVSGGPVGGPFSGTQVYTLTSTRPTPVQIEVSADQPWISINGGTSPVTVNLSGTGATDTVTIGFSAAANSLSAGLYNGNVSFTNLTTPPAGNTSRPVQLDVGRFTYSATDVPQGISDFQTITSNINVTDSYCIGDVNVEVDITHTYIGDLIVELKSPQGTIVRLHNRTGGSADNIVRTYDQGVTNPDGPGSLNDFNGQIVTGTWTLTVSDNATADVGSLNSWKLKIAASGVTCPPVASSVSANPAVCATTNITLSAVGTGGPLSYIITSLPAVGQLIDPNGGVIGSVPYTLLSNGNVVRYRPQPYYMGPASFTYKANDGQDSNTASVSLSIGAVQVIHDFPLNSDPGWSRDVDWAFGVPTGGGTSGRFDPTSGFTGANVYGYNLNGHYPNNLTPTRYLRTPALNCAGYTSVRLSFRRWLGVESATYDRATVDVSNNGTTWTNIYTNPTASFSEQSWTFQQYDISAIANNQPTVFIRWGMGTTDSSVTYQGWNLDDIQITGLRPPKLGDIDDDGDCDDLDVDTFVQVLLELDTDELHVCRCDLNIDGSADGGDVAGMTAARLAP